MMTQRLRAKLVEALSHCSMSTSQLNDDQLSTLWLQSSRKAEQIYSVDNRGRSLDVIAQATFNGSLGEVLIARRLEYYGLEVRRNDEGESQEFSWDIEVSFYGERYRLEVKQQKAGKEYFSFNHPQQCETLRRCWRSFAAVIGWCVSGVDYGPTLVTPWVLIDSEAFNPERELFVRSGFRRPIHPEDDDLELRPTTDPGYFLKMGMAQGANLLTYL